MKSVVDIILKELENLAKEIHQEELETVCESMCSAQKEGKKIFLAGAGRSGCVVRAFANRLMHLGFICHFVGEITTPPLKEGDILFVLSGSGRTESLVKMAEKTKQCHGRILTMTLQKDGEIARMAEYSIVLPGNTRLQKDEGYTSMQPIGSNFEQLSWLTCDGLIMMMRDQLNLTNKEMLAHHANLK